MKVLTILMMFPLFLFGATPGHVLFCEASIATHEEKIMIATVMYNRIDNKNFGNLSTLSQVVNQRRAFSCINDPKNKNWVNWWKLNPIEKEYWERLANSPNILKYDDIVFYDNIGHKTDLSKWTSAGYKPILKYTTKHFKFYSLEIDKSYVSKGWKPKIHDTVGKKVKKSLIAKTKKR